jgi:hypothetical protein
VKTSSTSTNVNAGIETPRSEREALLERIKAKNSMIKEEEEKVAFNIDKN